MKTIKKIACAALSLWATAPLYAQDNGLVTNGSFENTTGQKFFTKEKWTDSVTSSNNTSVDIFQSDACYHDYKAPDNYMGSQNARTGNNYAGITAYYADDAGIFKTVPGYRKYSEYIQFKLSQPLQKGKAYTVTYHVSLAEKSAYGVSGLGVYLSSTKVDIENNAFLPVTPHMVTTDVITTHEWTAISGTYVANGGEQYLTIGCFQPYMVAQKVIPENTNNSRKAFYYVDDVSMVPEVATPEAITSILFGSCYALDNLHFETDKAVIMGDSFTELDALASFLKRYPYIVVYIDGHTDKTGTNQHNDVLSEQRAAAVKTYLQNEGVLSSRLKVRGYGESKPVVETDESSAANRRVEITICGAALAAE